MQAGIDIGPCVDEGQLETDLKYIEIGRKECGDPRCGGSRLTTALRQRLSSWSPPSLPMSREDTTIAREEIFGPVLAVMRAADFEDAMRIANDIPFGLSASMQTTNLSRAFEFVYRIEAGPADRQSAERGRRISASLRRHQGLQFRPQGTGPRRARILLRLQDRLPEILKMKLGQISLNGVRHGRALRRGGCRLIPGHTALDVVAGSSPGRQRYRRSGGAGPIVPINPPEVWGCGCTYETSASFRDAEHGTREGMYAHVYREARPEVFFKGTARHCVGTGRLHRHPPGFQLHRPGAGSSRW